MKSIQEYKTDIERTIRSLLYQTQYTRAERRLLENGWKPIGLGLWVDEKSPERGDCYACLQIKALGLC